MKVLVTGAAGFIGSHLCDKLIADGNTVVGLDNFDPFYDVEIKRKNLAGCFGDERFSLVEGDIRDGGCLESIFSGDKFDIVVHLAAKAGVRGSIEDPLGYQDVNINGTMTVLEAVKEAGVKKFVFASSSSVYGNNKKIPFAEIDNVDFPISPYAASKKAGELICHVYHHLYDISVMCLRFFTVYGPRQRPDLAISKFTRLILTGKEVPMFGDGSMARDFTYIDDIISGILAAMEACNGYKIFNLGESRPYRLDNLISELERVLNKKAIIKRLPVPDCEVKQTYADIVRAQTKLGYQPQTRLPEGLKNFVSWLTEEAKSSE
jgi:UDP-glucuronate 4-epimerase